MWEIGQSNDINNSWIFMRSNNITHLLNNLQDNVIRHKQRSACLVGGDPLDSLPLVVRGLRLATKLTVNFIENCNRPVRNSAYHLDVQYTGPQDCSYLKHWCRKIHDSILMKCAGLYLILSVFTLQPTCSLLWSSAGITSLTVLSTKTPPTNLKQRLSSSTSLNVSNTSLQKTNNKETDCFHKQLRLKKHLGTNLIFFLMPIAYFWSFGRLH